MEIKKYELLSDIKQIIEKKDVALEDYDRALELIDMGVEENYKIIRDLNVNLSTATDLNKVQIISLISGFTDRVNALLLQKAKIYCTLGEKNNNHDMLKESIKILIDLPQYFLVKVNIIKSLCSLAKLEHDIKYVEMAKNIIDKHGIKEFNKGIVFKVNAIIEDLNKEYNGGKNYVILRKIYTDLYHNTLDFEELANADILEWDREILFVAFYETFNKKKGLSFINDLKKKYVNDSDKVKTLNKLKSSLESKKTNYFDIGKYGNILDVCIDFNQEIEHKIEEYIDNSDKKIDPVTKEVLTPKKEKKEKKMISCKGKTVNRYTNSETTSNKKNIDSKNISEEIEDNKTVVTIKDVYTEESNDIASYLFACTGDVETRALWVKRLDNFMTLIDYPIDNKEKFDKFMKILIGCNNSHVLKHQIDMDTIQRDSVNKKKIKNHK